MVEIMERRREVEWSPDMELEGCDAEKAAALLLAVAPDRRSQSFDAKEASSSPNGIGIRNGSALISNGTLDEVDVMKPSATPGSPTRSRGPPLEISGGVYDSVREAQNEEANIKREGNAIGGSRLSPRLSPYRGPSAPMTSSPPRRPSSLSTSGSGSRMLQLADLATQELLTMDDEDEDTHDPEERNHHRWAVPYDRKPRSPSNSSSSSSSPSAMSITSRRPQRSPGLAGGHSDPADAASAAGGVVGGSGYPGAITSRKHNHHLRQRGPHRRSCYGQDDEFEEREEGVNGEVYDDEREKGVMDTEAYSTRGRRNRPRSVSMPEGMERERARAFSGGYSRGGRIEAIEEEFDGSDGHPGTRSRGGWRSSGGSGSKDKGVGQDNAVVGSVEDAEALIALARQRVGWGAETSEGAGGMEEGAGGVTEGEGGICVSLPHMLSKYADMYNKNGRIGIYTRQEREAIIARFKRKRSRRVWKKKIRYNCRKNLADKRLRVKGRFVKMSPEQRAALKLKQKHKALKNGRVAGGGGGSAGSGSVDMELLGSEEMGSGETASGVANGDGFEMEEAVGVEGDDEGEEEEGDDDEEDDDEDEEVFPVENLKRVRRHSIAY